MTPEMLQAMRDPLGAPAHPIIFQILLVVTYVLHIFFVTASVGGLGLALYGLYQKGENWQRLAKVATRVAVNTLGLGITMGVAPLLFVQVIYDPAWYTATTLMGLWTVLFIPVVALGYFLLYVFYLRGQLKAVGYTSLFLLLLAGFIMHSLSSSGLYPSRWLEWYAPGGVVDGSGVKFYGYNLYRFATLLFGQAFLSLGVILTLFTWYFRSRPDVPQDFISFVTQLARKTLAYGSLLFGGFGLLWAFTQGREVYGGMAIAPALFLLALAGVMYLLSRKAGPDSAISVLLGYLGVLLGVGIHREVCRVVALGGKGYSALAYPYNWDWGSILLFVVTALAAVPVIVYLAQVVYISGRTKEGASPSEATERFGDLGVKLLFGWVVFFFVLGLYTVLRA
ncbi:MAG: hypothetical protein ACUVS9_06415 [Thermaceae bacterium]